MRYPSLALCPWCLAAWYVMRYPKIVYYVRFYAGSENRGEISTQFVVSAAIAQPMDFAALISAHVGGGKGTGAKSAASTKKPKKKKERLKLEEIM